MCKIHYDKVEECFILKDPERGLKFKVFADSAKAVAVLRRLWSDIADAISRTSATELRVKGKYVTLVPIIR